MKCDSECGVAQYTVIKATVIRERKSNTQRNWWVKAEWREATARQFDYAEWLRGS